MMRIVAPPMQGGVLDFSRLLQARMGAGHATLMPLTRENAQSGLDADLVLLQMSGYSFAQRGAPHWLLRQLRAQRPRIGTLGIFFHELYAFGPPWRSSFWLSPVQRHVAAALANLADFWITSNEASARWLRRHAAARPNGTLPVFSNVGEPDTFASTRAPHIVVFGGAEVRLRTYRQAGPQLFEWARQRALQLHDIGPPLNDAGTLREMADGGAVIHGRLESAAVSTILRGAMFGALAYAVDGAAKSGVFAAYCAHGACPVLLPGDSGSADGLVRNAQYVAGLPGNAIGAAQATAIGQRAWSWYQGHRLDVHVEMLARLVADTDNTKRHAPIVAGDDGGYAAPTTAKR